MHLLLQSESNINFKFFFGMRTILEATNFDTYALQHMYVICWHVAILHKAILLFTMEI